MRAWSTVLAAMLLALAAPACGAGHGAEPRRSAPRTSPPAPCTERLVCNAPVCSCPEGYRCVVLCDEPRPGCAECVR